MTQYRAARMMQAKPLVNSTYELVHRFLLIGKDRSQTRPSANAMPPSAIRIITFCEELLWPVSRTPAATPEIADAIAGIVPSRPSGSQVFDCRHRCGSPRIVLSSQAPMFPEG